MDVMQSMVTPETMPAQGGLRPTVFNDLSGLHLFRRSELYRYAEAYGIDYSEVATKTEMLTILEAARINGDMARPKYPELLEPIRDSETGELERDDAGTTRYAISITQHREMRGVTVEGEATDLCHLKWRGPHAKWGVMYGEDAKTAVLAKDGFESREAAQTAINNGEIDAPETAN